ncbi:MAG TPA: hypothetical protein VLQ91_22605, partial [Draconibacterium sp.]|nr:hypothetical protein [Draconibacterium sp.]
MSPYFMGGHLSCFLLPEHFLISYSLPDFVIQAGGQAGLFDILNLTKQEITNTKSKSYPVVSSQHPS